MQSALLRTLTAALLGLVLPLSLLARDEGPAVAYYPQTENVEGDQPLYYTYELEITSPSNLAPGTEVSITPVLFVIRAPEGVSDAAALSHVSMSPSTLVFTGPSQKVYTTVISDFPVGSVAGEYAFGIRTPGWGVTATDTFGFINAKVFPPRQRDVPSITLNTPADGTIYTWTAGGPPVTVPVQFSATAPVSSPITSVDADISGTAVNLTSVTGLGTGAAEAGGPFYISAPGVYTVTARATNDVGTSTDSAEITVNVVAPPPTVAIAQPANGASFTVTTGETLTVPFVFSGTSVYGGITQLTATLNDQPVSFAPAGLGTLEATGTASLSITTGGVYVLSVSASNDYGTSATIAQFTVTTVDPTPPPPTVTITSPADGTVITRVAGTPATAVPFTFTAEIETGWSISSIGATLNGQTVAVTASGLGTVLANGSGTLFVSAPGTYTLVATGDSAGSSAAASVIFTVTETAPVSSCCINWLPPICLGKVQQGGSVLPIKFTLQCCKPKDSDHECVKDKDRCGWGSGWGWGWDRDRDEHCDRHGHRSQCDDYDRRGKAADHRECSKGKYRRDDSCERHGHRSRCDSGYDDRECSSKRSYDYSRYTRCDRHGSRSHCDEHDYGHGHAHGQGHSDCTECNPDHCGKPGHKHNWCDTRDTTVVISIYEIFANGTTSEPKLYTYSPCSPNPPTYTINGGNMYHLNFPTARGKHRYHIDVYRQPAGSATPQLVGTKEFTTK